MLWVRLLRGGGRVYRMVLLVLDRHCNFARVMGSIDVACEITILLGDNSSVHIGDGGG
jgi:hypothetical protein